jgi:ATP-dependent helicase/nuclease subunit A
MKEPPREEQAATTGELGGAVRLLTVHKAKGLDFPVVILPDLDRRGNDARGRVFLDTELGPLVSLKADEESDDDEEATGSLGWMVHRKVREAEEADEALRVFYVAATRARELLVLSTSDDPQGKPRSAAMRLLVDRFDPTSGACRKDLPDGWNEPRVRVLLGGSGNGERAGRGKRPIPLRAVARLIDAELASPASTLVGEGREKRASGDAGRTSYVDLDLDSGRLDRLVRAILLDPRALRRGALRVVADELARRQVPAAGAGLVDEAVSRTRHWVEASLGRAITSAVEVRRDLAWTSTWPEGSPGATVISGRLDLAYRDRAGGWHLVNVADTSAPVDPVRLRLAVSSRLAIQLGCAPVAQAWLLTHGPEGGLRSEDPADDMTIGELLRATLAPAGPRELLKR